MRDVRVYPYGKGSKAILTSPGMAMEVGVKAGEVLSIYRALVAHRTGKLSRSASVSIMKGGPGKKKDRWVGMVDVSAEYALTNEYGRRVKNPYAGEHALADAIAQLSM